MYFLQMSAYTAVTFPFVQGTKTMQRAILHQISHSLPMYTKCLLHFFHQSAPNVHFLYSLIQFIKQILEVLSVSTLASEATKSQIIKKDFHFLFFTLLALLVGVSVAFLLAACKIQHLIKCCIHSSKLIISVVSFIYIAQIT